jgi:hypothetical protein
VTVLLPEPVCQFIMAFDEAVYLTLIREGHVNSPKVSGRGGKFAGAVQTFGGSQRHVR